MANDEKAPVIPEYTSLGARNYNPVNLNTMIKWDNMVGVHPGDPVLGRPDLAIFKDMPSGMRAALRNMYNAALNRPKSTVQEQVMHFASTSKPEEVANYVKYLKENGVSPLARLMSVDPMQLTQLMAEFETGHEITRDHPDWQTALQMLQVEGFKPSLGGIKPEAEMLKPYSRKKV